MLEKWRRVKKSSKLMTRICHLRWWCPRCHPPWCLNCQLVGQRMWMCVCVDMACDSLQFRDWRLFIAFVLPGMGKSYSKLVMPGLLRSVVCSRQACLPFLSFHANVSQTVEAEVELAQTAPLRKNKRNSPRKRQATQALCFLFVLQFHIEEVTTWPCIWRVL